MDFIADRKMDLVRLDHEAALPGLSLAEDSVVAALRVLLDRSRYPVLISCNLGRHHTGTIVGCMRKLQRWNLASIFEEYQRYAAGKVVRALLCVWWGGGRLHAGAQLLTLLGCGSAS